MPPHGNEAVAAAERILRAAQPQLSKRPAGIPSPAMGTVAPTFIYVPTRPRGSLGNPFIEIGLSAVLAWDRMAVRVCVVALAVLLGLFGLAAAIVGAIAAVAFTVFR